MLRQPPSNEEMHHRPAGFSLHPNRCIKISEIRHADFADRIPVLAEGLCLSRCEEGEVWLVVGINASHQLNVRPIGVGEATIPRISEFVVAPGPLLLPRSNMMIGDMDHAGTGGVVVPT